MLEKKKMNRTSLNETTQYILKIYSPNSTGGCADLCQERGDIGEKFMVYLFFFLHYEL